MRAFGDPLPQDSDFLRLHRLGCAAWILWHQAVRILSLDPLDHLALFRMTGHDGVWLAGALAESGFFEIQPKPGFARRRVWPVATEAVTGQDGLHVLIEIKVLPRLNRGGARMIAPAPGDCYKQCGGHPQGRCPMKTSRLG
jgi:hypothetical protein